MTFAPIVGWWALAAVTAVVLALCIGGLRRAPRRRLAWARRAMIVGFLAALAARPGAADAESTGLVTDLDVYFVVDRTASMVAEDYDGSHPRLDGVKADLLAVTRQLPGARFSLLGYDNEVQTLVPLTSDANAVAAGIRVLNPEVTLYSTGSSPRLPVDWLEEKLRAAAEQEPERRRALFVVADGEATATEQLADPFDPLAELIDGGAVLGYGTRRGGRMREWLGTDGPGRPYIFDPVTGEDAISRIDDETLRAIAAELDVEYEHRQAPGSVATIVDGLDQGGRAASGDAVPVRTDRAWLLALLLVAVVLWELGAVTGDVVRATSIAGVGPASRRRSGVAAEGPRTSSVETVGDLSGGGS